MEMVASRHRVGILVSHQLEVICTTLTWPWILFESTFQAITLHSAHTEEINMKCSYTSTGQNCTWISVIRLGISKSPWTFTYGAKCGLQLEMTSITHHVSNRFHPSSLQSGISGVFCMKTDLLSNVHFARMLEPKQLFLSCIFLFGPHNKVVRRAGCPVLPCFYRLTDEEITGALFLLPAAFIACLPKNWVEYCLET